MSRTPLAAALGAALSLTLAHAAVAAPASPPAREKAGGPLTLKVGDVASITPLLQYRLRFLAHSGKDLAPGGTFDAFSHRARLGMKVRALRWFSAMIQLQDVRLWGEETNTLGDYRADGFDVHQAWAAADCPYGLGIKAGRQEINLDDERLVGAVGWSDQARSFDALLLRYTRGGFKLRIWWARRSGIRPTPRRCSPARWGTATSPGSGRATTASPSCGPRSMSSTTAFGSGWTRRRSGTG